MNVTKLDGLDPNFPLWHSRAFPVQIARPDGSRRRILVAGDSFVWGDGYANMNDLWWRQLERELHRRGYWNVEVFGLGACSASTQNEFGWLSNREMLRRVQPNIIIWGYVANDPDMVDDSGNRLVKQLLHRHIDLIQSALRDNGLGYLARWVGTALPVVAFQLDERLLTVREHKAASKAEGYPYDEWELKLLSGENFEAFKSFLGNVRQLLRSFEIPCFFLTLPNYPDASHFRPRYQAVAPEFQRAGVPFHDVSEAFVASYPVGRDVTTWGITPANGHPGTCSTHFFASQAADILETQYRDALGPQTPPPPSVQPAINDWMPPWMVVEKSRSNELRMEFSNGRMMMKGSEPTEWAIRFPDGRSAPLLFMPIRQPHVLFCFEHPVSVASIQLTVPAPVTVDLYASVVDNNLGFDRGDLIPLGQRTGTVLAWSLSEKGRAMERLNTLRIAGGFLQQSPPVAAQLKIVFAEPAVRP